MDRLNRMINPIPSPPRTMKNGPIRVGLVGVTGYGAAYFQDLNRLVDEGRVKWAAATIINPGQAPEEIEFFKKRSVPVYSDYLEMLSSEEGNLDWVCIPTGIGWHKRMTLECLRRGLEVTVEKPLAPTLQDVREIQEAEARTGLSVSVGFQYMYQKETWGIKERLIGGEIGEVQRIDCLACWPRPKSYYARNSWSGHLHDGDSWILDSPLHNALCHLINLILFWSGDSLGESADILKVQAETYRAKPIESYDTVRTVVGMDSGIEAAVVLTHSTQTRFDPEIRITGTEGDIVWRFAGDYTVTAGGKSTIYQQSAHLKVRENMFRAIVDRMNGKDVRVCTTDLAKGAVKWVNAVHDTTEIHSVAPEFRKCDRDETGDEIDTVLGLGAMAERSYREGKMFQELGAPWAVAPGEREVSGYETFEARYCQKPLTSLESEPPSKRSASA